MKKIVNILLVVYLLTLTVGCSNSGIIGESEEDTLFMGYENEVNQDALFLDAMQAEQSRGNFGSPDFEYEGRMYYVQPDGTFNVITEEYAVNLVKKCKWIDVNGSMTSLTAAVDSTKLRAKALNSSMVLVYIAQGADYWDANDAVFKYKFSSLVNKVTAYNIKINVMSHSWSGHIVTNLVKNNSLVTHFAINPAHGNFKEGEKVADYVNDIKQTKGKIYILAGTSDLVARYGGGIAWKEWWGIVGYNSVHYAITDTSKATLIKVNGAGHLMENMLDHGAFDKINNLL